MNIEELRELALEEDLGHWIVDEEVELNDTDEVIELIQTGSVTTKIAGKHYIIQLVVEEVK